MSKLDREGLDSTVRSEVRWGRGSKGAKLSCACYTNAIAALLPGSCPLCESRSEQERPPCNGRGGSMLATRPRHRGRRGPVFAKCSCGFTQQAKERCASCGIRAEHAGGRTWRLFSIKSHSGHSPEFVLWRLAGKVAGQVSRDTCGRNVRTSVPGLKAAQESARRSACTACGQADVRNWRVQRPRCLWGCGE